MENKLIVTAAPHITSADSTQKIMGRVCLALCPALIASMDCTSSIRQTLCTMPSSAVKLYNGCFVIALSTSACISAIFL